MAKREKSAGGEPAERARKKARKEAKAEEKAAPALPLSKKERKAARVAAEGKADAATRQAATEAFLAAREAAEAQAQSEARAAKAEKEARRAEREERERQAKLAKRGGGSSSSSLSYPELQREAAVRGAASEASADGNGTTEMLRGDWACPGCGAICFANRTACYKCGTAGGNARPGDWVCGPCGASVFASKASCYKCGAAKGTDGPGVVARPKKEWAPSVANGLATDLKDVHATCRDCGAGFVVTAGEQDFYRSKGFDVCVPSRCTPCTAAKP